MNIYIIMMQIKVVFFFFSDNGVGYHLNLLIYRLLGWTCLHRRLDGAHLQGVLPPAIGNLSNLVSL